MRLLTNDPFVFLKIVCNKTPRLNLHLIIAVVLPGALVFVNFFFVFVGAVIVVVVVEVPPNTFVFVRC